MTTQYNEQVVTSLLHLINEARVLLDSGATMYDLRSILRDIVEGAVDVTDGVAADARPTADGVERHPSYGMVTLVQSSGHTRHFGSNLPYSSTSMRVRVEHGIIDHTATYSEHSCRFDFGNKDRHIVEFEFSPVQWANFISSVGNGGGVPCTVRSIRGRSVGEVPEHTNQHIGDRQAMAMHGKLRAMVDKKRSGNHEIYAAIDNLATTQKAKAALRSLANDALKTGADDAEYALSLFIEHHDKLLMAQQVEMEASKQFMVQTLGFEKLDDLREAYNRRKDILGDALSLPENVIDSKPV